MTPVSGRIGGLFVKLVFRGAPHRSCNALAPFAAMSPPADDDVGVD
jgi:hypothetical protein